MSELWVMTASSPGRFIARTLGLLCNSACDIGHRLGQFSWPFAENTGVLAQGKPLDSISQPRAAAVDARPALPMTHRTGLRPGAYALRGDCLERAADPLRRPRIDADPGRRLAHAQAALTG